MGAVLAPVSGARLLARDAEWAWRPEDVLGRRTTLALRGLATKLRSRERRLQDAEIEGREGVGRYVAVSPPRRWIVSCLLRSVFPTSLKA